MFIIRDHDSCNTPGAWSDLKYNTRQRNLPSFFFFFLSLSSKWRYLKPTLSLRPTHPCLTSTIESAWFHSFLFIFPIFNADGDIDGKRWQQLNTPMAAVDFGERLQQDVCTG
jgi:hypothetical protein